MVLLLTPPPGVTVLPSGTTGMQFDVYAAASPNGPLLATLVDARDKQVSISLDGPGAGTFTLPRSSAQATPGIIAQGNLVKVRLPDVSSSPIASFWMETGRFDLVGTSERGSELLTFGGSGSRSYLSRAIMWSQTFLAGETGPANGEWPLWNALNGAKAGAILRRLVAEAVAVGRPQQPLPSLSFDFTYTLDSAGATWSATPSTGGFLAHVGDGLDEVVAALQSTVPSLVVLMDANLGLHAYNSFGVDRHSATFASGKVRLEKGVNIATALTRELGASKIKSHILVSGDPGIYGSASNALTPVREGFASSSGIDTAVLDSIASGQLALRSANADSIRVGIPYGNTPTTTGRYMPGPAGTSGHYWVGDTITVHTGTSLPDYNESSQRIAEIALGETEAGDVIVEVALGSTYSGSDFARIHDVITEQRTDVQILTNEALRYAHSVNAPRVVAVLPVLPDPTFPIGTVVFLTTDTKLYRNPDNIAWTRALDGADIVAGTILAGALAVGSVTAEALAAEIILGSLIETADSGRRVEMDADGIRLFDGSDGLLVNIPTDGSPVFVSGQISASSLVVTGNADIHGAANSFAKESGTTFQAGVQPPIAAPALNKSWPAGVTFAAPALSSWYASGGYYDAAGGVSGSTPCYVALVWDGDNSLAKVYEWTASTGAINRITTLTGGAGAVRFSPGQGFITRIGSNWFIASMFDPSSSLPYILVFPRATGVFGGAGNAGAGVFTAPITTDGTFLYQYNLNTPAITRFVAGAPWTAVTTTVTGMAAHTTGGLFYYADIGAGGRFWIASAASGVVYEVNASTYAVVANTDFPVAANVALAPGFYWDGTNFFHVPETLGTAKKYTSWTWTTASSIYWVAYAWLDSAGTTHETSVGPRRSITMGRRQQLTVGNDAIPVGGADDPNQVRVYMLPNATDPGPGAFKLQSTDALTTRTLVTYNSGGATDGGGTPFVGGIGAVLQSAGAGWLFRGNGSMKLGGASFPGSPVTGDVYYRTDLDLLFKYDGTRWLSVELFTMKLDGLGGISSSIGFIGIAPAPTSPGSDIWLVDLIAQFLVSGGTALSGSHKWVGTFNKAPTGNTNTLLETVTINSGASSVWRTDTEPIGALMNAGTLHFQFTMDWTKTGTPGNLFLQWYVTYRIVAT